MKIIGRMPDSNDNLEQKIREALMELKSQKPDQGYTVMGLMVAKLGVPQSAIENKQFKYWEKEHVNLYNGIKRILERGVKEGKFAKGKSGRAFLYQFKE